MTTNETKKCFVILEDGKKLNLEFEDGKPYNSKNNVQEMGRFIDQKITTILRTFDKNDFPRAVMEAEELTAYIMGYMMVSHVKGHMTKREDILKDHSLSIDHYLSEFFRLHLKQLKEDK
jgi:hypothetical protein